jgi:hypothetical protein
MTHKATFFTPTFDRDLDRFTLLRESMERCGVEIPHIAVVDHEDLPLFEKIPFKKGLTLVSSRDVLPPDIEARRSQKHLGRFNPTRFFKPGSLLGWMAQQLMKVASPDIVDSEAVLCLDSDVFFVRNITEDMFFAPDGKLHLYADPDACTVETVMWMANSMKAFHVPYSKRPTCFIHNPVPIHREGLLDMRQFLEKTYNKRWIDAFLECQLTEYTSYGVFARDVNNLKHHHLTQPPYTLNYWVAEEMENIESDLIEKISDTDVRIVLINSSAGRPVSEYRHLVEKAWMIAEQNPATAPVGSQNA